MRTVELIALGLEEHVLVGLAGVEIILIPVHAVGIDVIPLRIGVGAVVARAVVPALRYPIRILFQIVATLTLVLHAALAIGQFAQRGMVERVGSRENLVEIATLVIVEREVQERVAVGLRRIHETSLIETEIGLAHLVESLRIFLGHNAHRDTGGAMTEHADGSRIGADGRDISAQGIERTTHTHIAGCAVEISAQQTGILVRILCSRWQHG